MDASNQLEHAANQMKQLVDGDLVNKLRGENEATIRLLIIDQVLSILGWQRHEYKPEKVTSTGNYTDYRLSIENQARLIVEAKRIGVISSFPKPIRQRQYNNSFNIGQAPHRQVIRAIFDQFMGDITRPGQEKMLEYCYVEDYTTNEFSRELQQILQYDARLDELDMAIEEADDDSLERELDFQSHSRHPKTILLVGNVGAGKSTFIHRFSRKAQPNRNICTIVDLINHSTKEIERNQAEEQRLAELVIDNLALEFRDKADPYSPEILRGCFEVEINRFRKQRQNLLKQDPGNFSVKEEEFIFDLSKDKYKHLVGYLKYIRKKRYRAWLALDNVDRGSESYQAFIYAFAHRLSADAGCVTLITLRQDTYLEAQEAGFLDVRSSDIIFQLTAPEFRQVVSKRREFIEQMIERSETPRPFKSEIDLIRVLNWHITRLVLTEDDFVRLLITTFSLNNVRYGLQMLRDYYTSYHSTFHEFYQNHPNLDSVDATTTLNYEQEANRLLQSLMLGNSWNYLESKSEIYNVFWVNPLEKTSHFLTLKVLAYLSIQHDFTSSKISIKYDKVCNDFISLGYQRHHINNIVRKLLYAGLIVSPNLPDNPAAEIKVSVPDPLPKEMKVAITGRGHYYLKKLAAHKYYRTRIGEDTIWYSREAADRYIECLREALQAQSSGSDDALLATNAREIFLKYLAQSLMEENQSYLRLTTEDWALLMNEMVEKCVFGKSITKPIHMTEVEALNLMKELLEGLLNSINETQIEEAKKKQS